MATWDFTEQGCYSDCAYTEIKKPYEDAEAMEKARQRLALAKQKGLTGIAAINYLNRIQRERLARERGRQ